MARYLCIHGHFYQPPRENAWLESIEVQDSAYPYHDWNERVTAECYAPNAVSRILDEKSNISRIVNNYSRISFNFGPTLLAWLEERWPLLHSAIVDADHESRKRFSGHGSAMAQAYNHIILPLANRRDKETQVIWGLRDFERRFGREAEGMWLPETAVNIETLEVLAANGLKFTVLAPGQCARVRKTGEKNWHDTSGGKVDPSRAYKVDLPSGRSIAVFFYDGAVAQAVAFERLLNSGETFAQRLTDVLHDHRREPQLSHIATDGETYGHHHRFGDMALAYALDFVENRKLARLTNYGEFLEIAPPKWEAEIVENTAWSCSHGVGRWKQHCGCNAGGGGGKWRQDWRAPLREALDWLRDWVAPRWEKQASELFRDPWEARDGYIEVILDRDAESRQAFLRRYGAQALQTAEHANGSDEVVRAWSLMELQRHAQLMYTSCGWFFDDVSGIETAQVIQYAGRVVQLAEALFGERVEPEFVARLEKAKSNLPEEGDGAHIYAREVTSRAVDLVKCGAHYAIRSLFEPYEERARVYTYTVERKDFRVRDAGRMRMVIGRAHFQSNITGERGDLSFGALHLGDHNVLGGVETFRGDAEYRATAADLESAFARADVPAVLSLLDSGYVGEPYSLRSLFRDEQRRIVEMILRSTLDSAEGVYRQLYEEYGPLMRFLGNLNAPLPKAFQTTAEFALNSRLRIAFEADDLDVDRIAALLDEVRVNQVALDATTLEFALRRTVERLAARLAEEPLDFDCLHAMDRAAAVLKLAPLQVELWEAQNHCYEVRERELGPMKRRSASGVEDARTWLAAFTRIGEALRIRVD